MTDVPESPFAALHCIVRGRVQGVNFRSFVRQHAGARGLTGYVRNLRDGRSVEVFAEGSRDRLEKLLDHLYEGPWAARVDEVEPIWEEFTARFSDFRVTYEH